MRIRSFAAYAGRCALALIASGLFVSGTLSQTENCPPGSGAIIGNLTFASTLEWNVAVGASGTPVDGAVDFAYFFVADPRVNEGLLGEPSVFLLQAQDITVSDISEAIISGISISANIAFGTNGCPLLLEDKRGIFLFKDSGGTVVVSVDAVGTDWNFDNAAAGSTVESPALAAFGLSGKVLPKSRGLNPRVTGSVRNADGSTTVSIAQQPPSVHTDAPFELAVAAYRVFGETVPSGEDPGATALLELSDLDGSSTDTRATVTLVPTAGADTFLFVRADLANSLGRGVMSGPSSRILTDPTLATPGRGRGKGKGLNRAPGQNR